MVLKVQEQKSKESFQSFKFSDSTEQNQKKNSTSTNKQSSEESKEINLENRKTFEPGGKKDSNPTSNMRSGSTFKEDSSILEFKDRQEAFKNDSPRRKLTALSQLPDKSPDAIDGVQSQIILNSAGRKDGPQFNFESNDVSSYINEFQKARR